MNIWFRSLVLLISLIFINGCYILLEHPDVKVTEEGETYQAAIMFFDDCADCHSTDEISEYYFLANDQVISPHKLNEEKFYRIDEHGNFDFFYNSVWWFEEEYNYYFIEDDYSLLTDSTESDEDFLCTRNKTIENVLSEKTYE
ncbi:MAG: hypothetical protein JEY94_17920 [Melioribacteraceae bacterium]|nr:hypothetical protein [Melioribacteraceae bacterium]